MRVINMLFRLTMLCSRKMKNEDLQDWLFFLREVHFWANSMHIKLGSAHATQLSIFQGQSVVLDLFKVPV